MNIVRRLISSVSFLAIAVAANTPATHWVPVGLPPPPADGPALTQGGFLTPEQGQAVLNAALRQFPDRANWDAYVQHVRTRMQEGAGLSPWPRRTPLNAIIRSKRTHDGYTVENVAFESVPGYFVTGNL